MRKNKKSTKRFDSKEIKRNKSINDDTKKVISFIIISIVVLGCLIGLYLLNGNLVTKDLSDETTTTASVNFDDSMIAITDVFNKKGTYYVLLYDKKDKQDGFLYDGLATSYKSDDVSLYSVDMSLKMNSIYYNKEGKANKTATNYKDLVITGPTLIKISKGKIADYITKADKISEILNK